MVMRFGTWNVRTVLQAGNMNMIAEEVERYKTDVVALQEIKWKGKDQGKDGLRTSKKMYRGWE